jgi:hypothetical protein
MGFFLAYLLILAFTDTQLSKRTLVYPRTIIVISLVLLGIKCIAMFVPRLSFLLGETAKDAYKTVDDGDELETENQKVFMSPARAQKYIIAKFMIWMITFMGGIYLIGFIPSMPIWLFIFCFFLSKLKLTKSIAITLGMFVGIYVTFVIILKMHFPTGNLF